MARLTAFVEAQERARQLSLQEIESLIAQAEAELSDPCEDCGALAYCIYRKAWRLGHGLERQCPKIRNSGGGQ